MPVSPIWPTGSAVNDEGEITFHGRTYKYIGYEWIEYIAQIDDTRALSIGLRNMDCVQGTMPDIILNNMTFQ